MKQTAVEWLYFQLIERINPHGDTGQLWETLQKAKQIEKEQIVDAFGIGCQVESTRLIGYQDMAEQYYNETYGKDSTGI